MGKVAGSAGRGSGGRPADSRRNAAAGGDGEPTVGVLRNALNGEGGIDASRLNATQRRLRQAALLGGERYINGSNDPGRSSNLLQQGIRAGVVTQVEAQRLQSMDIENNLRLQLGGRDSDIRAFRFVTDNGARFTVRTQRGLAAATARRMAVERGATRVIYEGNNATQEGIRNPTRRG